MAAVNFRKNPCDGDATEPTISQMSQMSAAFNGYEPEYAVGDRGYKGVTRMRVLSFPLPVIFQ
jgi:hypothetical protein